MFLIVTVQISIECETQEIEGGYHSLQRGQNPQICLQHSIEHIYKRLTFQSL